MEEVSLRRLQTIWFQLYNILKKANLQWEWKISVVEIVSKQGIMWNMGFFRQSFSAWHVIVDKERQYWVVSDSCDPMDCSLPASSALRNFQARILEWVAISSPGDLPDPEIEHRSPILQVDSLPTELSGKPISVDTWHYIFVKTNRKQNTSSKP